MWNPATLRAAPPADIYRSRQVFTPEATLVIAATTRVELRRQLRALRCTRPGSNGGRWGCGGENRVLQRGGKYSALPPALGFGDTIEQEQEASASYAMRGGFELLDTDQVLHAA